MDYGHLLMNTVLFIYKYEKEKGMRRGKGKFQATDPKKRIELSVTTRGGFTSWNCYGAGVDIRLMKDPAMSGVRYCPSLFPLHSISSPHRLCRPNTIFDAVYSDADHMVISLFARVNYVHFSFSARSI